MNTEQARFNMIEQQIRTWEVLDPNVLNLLHRIPREDFVPAVYRGLAFADLEIPLGHGQAMLSPKLEARMLQALNLKKTDTVLEIGTGSGYMTALLASLAGHVCSIERLQEFSHHAANQLTAHGISNVTLEVGDGNHLRDTGTYDAIVLTGSTPRLSEEFQHHLNPGGRLLAIVGEAPVMEAVLITCVASGTYRRTVLFETSVPALENALQKEHFCF